MKLRKKIIIIYIFATSCIEIGLVSGIYNYFQYEIVNNSLVQFLLFICLPVLFLLLFFVVLAATKTMVLSDGSFIDLKEILQANTQTAIDSPNQPATSDKIDYSNTCQNQEKALNGIIEEFKASRKILEEKNQSLTFFNNMDQSLHSTLDLHHVFDRFSNIVLQSMGSSNCRVALLDKNKNNLIIEADKSVPDFRHDSQKGRIFPINNFNKTRHLVSDEIMQVLSEEAFGIELSTHEREFFFPNQIKSILLKGINSKGDFLGYMILGELCNREHSNFTQEKIEFCSTLVNHAISAIENAKRYEETQNLYYQIVETALDAVITIDADGIIAGWNKQAENVFGWPRTEAIGRNLVSTIIPVQHREFNQLDLRQFKLTGKGDIFKKRIEITALHRGGHEFPVEMSISSPAKLEGKFIVSAFVHDITKRKMMEEQLKNMAHFDTLTGLPNRRLFLDRLEQAIIIANRNKRLLAVMYLDLDGFKDVNDTFGHTTGDLLLQEVALRFTSCARASDTVFRIGGDEFAIVLSEIENYENVTIVARRILNSMENPFSYNNQEYSIGVSIGISFCPRYGNDLKTILAKADTAMYQAKKVNGNACQIYYSDANKILMTV